MRRGRFALATHRKRTQETEEKVEQQSKTEASGRSTTTVHRRAASSERRRTHGFERHLELRRERGAPKPRQERHGCDHVVGQAIIGCPDRFGKGRCRVAGNRFADRGRGSAPCGKPSSTPGQAGSMLQIADGAMSRANDILTRMKALAVQAASGHLSNVERGMLNTEYTALRNEISRIGNDTEFNSVKMLAGSQGVTLEVSNSHSFQGSNGFDAVRANSIPVTAPANSSALDLSMGTNAAGVTFAATDSSAITYSATLSSNAFSNGTDTLLVPQSITLTSTNAQNSGTGRTRPQHGLGCLAGARCLRQQQHGVRVVEHDIHLQGRHRFCRDGRRSNLLVPVARRDRRLAGHRDRHPDDRRNGLGRGIDRNRCAQFGPSPGRRQSEPPRLRRRQPGDRDRELGGGSKHSARPRCGGRDDDLHVETGCCYRPVCRCWRRPTRCRRTCWLSSSKARSRRGPDVRAGRALAQRNTVPRRL